MKIFKLFVIIATITLISCKAGSKRSDLTMSEANNDDEFSENPIAGVAVPNDNYLLQQNEVSYFILLLN